MKKLAILAIRNVLSEESDLNFCYLHMSEGTLSDVVANIITHLSLASHETDIGKQCRPRSDAAERGVWSGSTLLALNTGISLKHGINKY